MHIVPIPRIDIALNDVRKFDRHTNSEIKAIVRENLDTKSVAFSILTLCTWTIWRETIEKLNANI